MDCSKYEGSFIELYPDGRAYFVDTESLVEYEVMNGSI